MEVSTCEGVAITTLAERQTFFMGLGVESPTHTVHIHDMDTTAHHIARHCLLQSTRRAARAVTAAYEAHLAPTGLSAGQFTLLTALAVAPVPSIAELGRRIGADRTTVSRLLAPLKARALVGPGETRTALALTAQGTALYREAIPLWEAAQAELLARLGEDEATSLRATLARF